MLLIDNFGDFVHHKPLAMTSSLCVWIEEVREDTETEPDHWTIKTQWCHKVSAIAFQINSIVVPEPQKVSNAENHDESSNENILHVTGHLCG